MLRRMETTIGYGCRIFGKKCFILTENDLDSRLDSILNSDEI